MEPRWSFVVGLASALVILMVALREWRRHPPGQRHLPAVLLITSALLMSSVLFVGLYAARRAAPATVAMDSNSVRATFDGISLRGPKSQLVFHYRLQSTTKSDFHIEPVACSMVSFRFVPGGKTDPASALLEKDAGSYRKYTGLVRLPDAPAMVMEPCPLDLAPGQSRTVEIAIPYAYAEEPNPSAEELRKYVRAVMPRVDGFGVADLQKRYQIAFPKGW